jgi:hypothetical protein
MTGAARQRGRGDTLLVNGEKLAEGRTGITQPGIFSADETGEIGIDLRTPVVRGHRVGSEVALHGADTEGNRPGVARTSSVPTRRLHAQRIDR